MVVPAVAGVWWERSGNVSGHGLLMSLPSCALTQRECILLNQSCGSEHCSIVGISTPADFCPETAADVKTSPPEEAGVQGNSAGPLQFLASCQTYRREPLSFDTLGYGSLLISEATLSS
ncbi:hypothetical protein Y1Q_0021230 [Alligator mississippiensis]|uniref:Uncharacterized protein n=1 Tax=Alligator mississippiensis TaxID=8496 RepID=A0A151MRZ6_ALLMI|nr:hypothetical protein Y1Q_0021230 [Alligator mississippiensis]